MKFQSTPPRGGRRRYGVPLCPGGCFNPRPRAGGDTGSRPSKSASSGFNPRPRAGGDLGGQTFIFDKEKFQSTPPRGGRRLPGHLRRPGQQVSIHAPARGATWHIHIMEKESLFQSTPPRGGRLLLRNPLLGKDSASVICEPPADNSFFSSTSEKTTTKTTQ